MARTILGSVACKVKKKKWNRKNGKKEKNEKNNNTYTQIELIYPSACISYSIFFRFTCPVALFPSPIPGNGIFDTNGERPLSNEKDNILN